MPRQKKVMTESPSTKKIPAKDLKPIGKTTTPTMWSKTITTEESETTAIMKIPAKRVLDRKRSFGTNMGPSKNGAVYEQDGFSFNVKGELIEAD